jgi:hypothetical protein
VGRRAFFVTLLIGVVRPGLGAPAGERPDVYTEMAASRDERDIGRLDAQTSFDHGNQRLDSTRLDISHSFSVGSSESRW